MSTQIANLTPRDNVLRYRPGDTVFVLCDATDGAFTVILPDAKVQLGDDIIIVKVDSASNAVTVECRNGQTISGDASVVIDQQYQKLIVRSDRTNYLKVNGSFVDDIPTAPPSDGDTTHFSTADQIYDFVTGQGYLTSLAHSDLTGIGSSDHHERYTDAEAVSAIKGDADWNASDWDAAYGWGDHAGIYDLVGAAASAVSTHESTYDHSDLHDAATVADTSSIDLTITGQQISGVVLPAGVDHNSLSNLTTGDPHSQYILADGTRAFTGVVSGVTPTSAAHLATKAYVDTVGASTTLDPVLDRFDPTSGLPGSPSSGDRYLATATANGWTVDYVYEYNGASWDETVPSSGNVVLVIDEASQYAYTGSEWTSLTATDHGALGGLSDDDHTQYLLADGTRALSGNWDAGGYEIRAETFESDVATGTAPLTIASTTLVSNLNADLLDGQEGSYYLDRANHTGTQAASTIGSGTFEDARIAQSNVTQHEAALSIAWSQITGEPATYAPSAHASSHESGGSDAVGHDSLTGFVANEHIDHSAVSVSAGGILSGGGTIAANRTISLSHSDVDHDQTTNFSADEHVGHSSITITAGAGLTGGGTIAENRTIAVGAGTGITVNADDVAFDVAWGDSRYLQSYTETDPVFSASDAAGISAGDISNWDSAYGWGDHDGLYDAAGTAASEVASHESTYNHDNYDTAYGWGNHASAGYLTSYTETDPVVGAISGIVKADGAGNISAAVSGTDYAAAAHTHAHGDLTGVGASDHHTRYADSEAVSAIKADGDWNASEWDTAYGWGDHASAGYLTSYTETDPVVGAITGIVKADGAGNIAAAVAGTDYAAVSHSHTSIFDADTDTGVQVEEGEDDDDTVRIDAGGSEVATFTGSLATLNTDLTLAAGTQDYKFTPRSNLICMRGQSTGVIAGLELYPYDGDGTDACVVRVFGRGTPADLTEFTYCEMAYSSNAYYVRNAWNSGSAQDYSAPIIFTTEGSSGDNNNQLVINSDGKIGIGKVPSYATLDVSGSIAASTFAALGSAATSFLTYDANGVIKSRTAAEVLSDIDAAESSHTHEGTALTGFTEDKLVVGAASGDIESAAGLDWDGSTLAVDGDITASLEDSGTDTVLYPLTLERTTSDTPAEGIGVGVSFKVEDDRGVSSGVGEITCTTDGTNKGLLNFRIQDSFDTVRTHFQVQYNKCYVFGSGTGDAGLIIDSLAGSLRDAYLALSQNGTERWRLYHDAATSITRVSANTRFDGIASFGANPTANCGDVYLCNTGVLQLKEVTTPTAVTDCGKVYCKADNKLYFQDGAGTEHEIAFV